VAAAIANASAIKTTNASMASGDRLCFTLSRIDHCLDGEHR
jgi:hypothetical protein